MGSGLQISHANVIGNTLGASFQNFIDQSSTLTAQNTTTGYPSPTGTFYSTVIGRAAIPDITNDMRASFGVERICTQQIIQIQNEQGPNGETVYGVLNDDRGLIRFVGSWGNANGVYGQYIQNPSTSDTVSYVEINFYGTGLNLVSINGSSGTPMMSIDGGTETSLLGTSGGSSVLGGRNYSGNIIIPVANGLTLGLHTIKIRCATCQFLVHGFEILNSNTSGLININKGTAYYRGQTIKNNTADSVAYNTGVTGVKGGRIVRYFSADDTPAQVFTSVNSSAAYLTSADHTNEEVARVFHWREFGAGRYNATYANEDDFSLLTGTARSAAFTLDDGTTTLIITNGNVDNEGLALANPSTVTFTFVGCGLDVAIQIPTGGFSVSLPWYLDGVAQTNIPYASWYRTGILKIASGLSYGTHTIIFSRDSASNDIAIKQFIVYQPKKPTIPTGAVEICDYNVMATYAANTVAGLTTIGTGLLRKHLAQREAVFVEGTGGTTAWTIGYDPVNNVSGYENYTDKLNASVQYSFFGVGFELRYYGSGNRSSNVAVTINGSALTLANFPNLAYTVYGGGSFNNSTGVLTMSTTVGAGRGFTVTGLPLGINTVKFNNGTASVYMVMAALDIITPIHSYKFNTPATLQNTLSIGSQSLNDSRTTSAIATTPKAWAQAVGVTSTPSSTVTTYIPMPDMSLTIKTSGGPILISYFATCYNATVGAAVYLQLFVDGLIVGPANVITPPNTTSLIGPAASLVVPVLAGYHKIDLYWAAGGGGTLSAYLTQRSLTVREL
jgi:hypothetical protein